MNESAFGYILRKIPHQQIFKIVNLYIYFNKIIK